MLDAPNHPPPHDHRRFRVFSHGIPENHSPRQGLEFGATTLAVKSLRGIVQGARFALWDFTSQAFFILWQTREKEPDAGRAEWLGLFREDVSAAFP